MVGRLLLEYLRFVIPMVINGVKLLGSTSAYQSG
jgi:hypothetical protein